MSSEEWEALRVILSLPRGQNDKFIFVSQYQWRIEKRDFLCTASSSRNSVFVHKGLNDGIIVSGKLSWNLHELGGTVGGRIGVT